MNLVDYLDRWTEKTPERHLFTFFDARGLILERYTFKEFQQRTAIIAGHIHQNHNIAPGDRVLLIYSPGIEQICAFFACLRLGLIPVPASAPSKGVKRAQERIASIAMDCNPALVLTLSSVLGNLDNSLLGDIQRIPTDVISLATDVFDSLRRYDIAFLQYTSGTTGDPKGVVISHINIEHNCHSLLNHRPIGVCWLPQHHDMGLIGHYLFPIIKGGENYGMSPLDFLRNPRLWLEKLSEVKATTTASPNFGYEYCLSHKTCQNFGNTALDLSSVTMMLNAAEPVMAGTLQRFYSKFKEYGLSPDALMSGYGLAENTIAVTNRGSNCVDPKTHELLGKYNTLSEVDTNNVLVSCGKPLSGISIYIADPTTGACLDEGRIGEIMIEGSSKSSGYWKDSEYNPNRKSALSSNSLPSSVTSEPLKSGDLGFIVDGELYISGRLKEVIIINGVNYYQRDINWFTHESFQESSIQCTAITSFGIKYGDAGESIVILFETRNLISDIVLQKTKNSLRAALATSSFDLQQVDKGYICKTTSGKISALATKEKWINENLHSDLAHKVSSNKQQELSSIIDRLETLLCSSQLGAADSITLSQAGLDSIELVTLVASLQAQVDLISESTTNDINVEIGFIKDQKVTDVIAFSRLLTQSSVDKKRSEALSLLQRMSAEYSNNELKKMRLDSCLDRPQVLPKNVPEHPSYLKKIFVTGGTGFLGIHLVDSLLKSTTAHLYLLVRCDSVSNGYDRISLSMAAHSLSKYDSDFIQDRITIIPGSLDRDHFGLDDFTWHELSTNVDCILHNGAYVNYISSYNEMRLSNVIGTYNVIQLASTTLRKPIYYVSTTFIFGWLQRGLLSEDLHNKDMVGLDFGYSQSKWVSEELIRKSQHIGIRSHIFRPALLSPSHRGGGNAGDITIRLLLFMLKYSIALDAVNQISLVPVDIASDDIVRMMSRSIHSSEDIPVTHMVSDSYYSFKHITSAISVLYGYQFEYLDLDSFVERVNTLCEQSDPLYPLVPFFNKSKGYIKDMADKRYCNKQYRSVRGRPKDAEVYEVAKLIMEYLIGSGLLESPKHYNVSISA